MWVEGGGEEGEEETPLGVAYLGVGVSQTHKISPSDLEAALVEKFSEAFFEPAKFNINVNMFPSLIQSHYSLDKTTQPVTLKRKF